MTKIAIALILLADTFYLGIIWGLEWESVPDDFVYACAGSKVTFPWRFKVTEGESLSDIHWIHDGALSSEMVAMMAHRHFLATKGYSARAHHVANGGLTLGDLRVEDAGNYTVEVNVDNQGSFRSVQHSVFLQVADGLMVQGGELKAAQDPEARWEESSQQWQIRLTCGAFTFLGPPPVDVTWTTPEGRAKSSSGYEAGHFYLSLVTPVQGGNYTCTIPPVRLPGVCHRKQEGRNIMALSATVVVDEMKTRLSLVEAYQKTLQDDNRRLQDDNRRLQDDQKILQEKLQDLERAHAQDVENVTEYCQDLKNTVQQQVENLQNTRKSMMDDIHTLWNMTVTGPCPEHTEMHEDWRSTEKGQATQCDKGTLQPGWYRFFLNGENAVIPTTCVPRHHCSTHITQWLDLQGQSLPEMGQEIVARACGNWLSGCCQWKSTVTVHNCGNYFVYNLQPFIGCYSAFCAEPQTN